jgi:hopanoid biosynthesis associated radical SAM protein HpnH
MYKVARYIAGRKLRGDKRYPLVLMLEPLFQCNLACSGCGKIDYPKEILQKRVSVDDALRAVDECGAPIVSIPGGEPLIHKEMPQIVAGIVARRKFVYLCTNAILLSSTSMSTNLRPISHSPFIWTAIGSVMTNRCARKECSTRLWRPSNWPSQRAFE